MKLRVPLFVLLCLVWMTPARSASLDDLKAAMEGKVAELTESIHAFQTRYEEELRKLETATQTAGDFEALLQIRQEIASFRTGAEPPKGAYEGIPKLQSLRKTYTENLSRLHREAEPKVGKVYEIYGEELVKLKTELTRQNKVEEALGVAEEEKRLAEFLAAGPLIPGSPADTAATKPEEENPLVGRSAHFTHPSVPQEIWVEFEENGEAVWVGLGQLAVAGWKYEKESDGNYLFWNPGQTSKQTAFRLKLEEDGRDGVVVFGASHNHKETPARMERTRRRR